MNAIKRIFILTLIIIPPFVPTNAVVNHAGVKIINDTNQQIRAHVSTNVGTFRRNLRPRESYLFSSRPNNLSVFMQNGSGSHFYDIAMNPVFDKLVVRTNPQNRRCATIGYYGQTRERQPRPFAGPIVFPPNHCHLRAWNPINGNIYTGAANEPPTPRSYQPGTLYN